MALPIITKDAVKLRRFRAERMSSQTARVAAAAETVGGRRCRDQGITVWTRDTEKKPTPSPLSPPRVRVARRPWRVPVVCGRPIRLRVPVPRRGYRACCQVESPVRACWVCSRPRMAWLLTKTQSELHALAEGMHAIKSGPRSAATNAPEQGGVLCNIFLCQDRYAIYFTAIL